MMIWQIADQSWLLMSLFVLPISSSGEMDFSCCAPYFLRRMHQLTSGQTRGSCSVGFKCFLRSILATKLTQTCRPFQP